METSLDGLEKKKVAVLGFGSQGHAHALNLRDSGVEVVVGLRPESPRRRFAEEAGLTVSSLAEAAAAADLVMMLIPDEHHGPVFAREIAPNLRPGRMLLVAHGFSIHFQQLTLAPEIDVAMVAPKGPGHLVRREFTSGRGVPALVAVHQDASGRALDLVLAYATGIGSARAGILETTIREETETDLFGEQAVLCGGITALMKAGFETLVEAGYQPEMAYFECINEMKLIVDLIYEGGFARMRHSISNTAEYGDYITQGKWASTEVKAMMSGILRDIQEGRFAREWILENQAGCPSFQSFRRREGEQEVERTGREIRKLMPWIQAAKELP